MIGAGTSLLALLALTAMHVLPAMGQDTQQPMVGMVHGVSAQAAPVHAVTGSVPTEPEVAAAHDADGAPWHGHSLMHLCFAVLVVALTLALARWLRPRLLAVCPTRAVSGTSARLLARHRSTEPRCPLRGALLIGRLP